MISVAISSRQLDRLAKKVAQVRAMTARQRGSFASQIAKGIKKIAERRVRTTKIAPDGTPWAHWTNSYAQTRSSQHSLLIDKRNLVRRFSAYASPAGRFVKVNNSAPYAGYVQSKRPFLGLGKLEEDLIDGLVHKFLRQVVS